MSNLETIINKAFDEHHSSSFSFDAETSNAVHESLRMLNSGERRICEHNQGDWHVNQWLKKAVLLSFKLNKNKLTDSDHTNFFDKIDGKYINYDKDQFIKDKVRSVPGSYVRYGAHVGENTVLMPCFVNIGAYVDSGVMVDTWATVGSCAQIGKNVHLSGGVGIGGVLEPLQANPTIIEDNCFIGARSEVVEGVIVKKNSVISMGVYIGKSTKIYNRLTGEITYGVIPEGSVVVPGSLPSQDGKYSLYAAIIIKQVDEKTRSKVAITKLLRDMD